MKNDNNFAVALTKCFYCGKDDAIVMTKLLTPKNARDVESMNGKVIDMTPCQECKKLMDQGIILITFDPEKSLPGWDTERIPNPYRTGGFFVVQEKAMLNIIGNKTLAEFIIKYRWMFIEHNAAEQLGLFKFMEDNKDVT